MSDFIEMDNKPTFDLNHSFSSCFDNSQDEDNRETQPYMYSQSHSQSECKNDSQLILEVVDPVVDEDMIVNNEHDDGHDDEYNPDDDLDSDPDTSDSDFHAQEPEKNIPSVSGSIAGIGTYSRFGGIDADGLDEFIMQHKNPATAKKTASHL